MTGTSSPALTPHSRTPMMDKLSAILRLPAAYRLMAGTLGGRGTRRIFLDEYVKPIRMEKILDIGCGPADILNELPKMDYTGLDISPDYIRAAQARFGARGRFLCIDVGLAALDQERGSFDLVLAKGVIHHLDDERAARLFELARLALKPAGRLVTFDGCYVAGQSRIARWLLSRDRGKFIRTQREYVRLVSASFARIDCFVRDDLLRVPYTHLIMRCSP